MVRWGCSAGLESDALGRIELNEDGLADGRTEGRVAPREHHPVAELHLEIDAFAEEDLLVHSALPVVGPVGAGFRQFDILRTEGEEDCVPGPQRLRGGREDVSNLR